MKPKFIQTRISDSLHKKLQERAEDEERSVSSLLRIIVKEYLKKE